MKKHELETEKGLFLRKMTKVMQDVITVIEIQDRAYNNVISSVSIKEAITDYKEEMKAIEN